MIPIAKQNAQDTQTFLRSLSENFRKQLGVTDFDIVVQSDGSHVVKCGPNLEIRCTPMGTITLNYPEEANLNLPDVPVLTPICSHNFTIAVYYLIDLQMANTLRKGFMPPAPRPEWPPFGDDTLLS